MARKPDKGLSERIGGHYTLSDIRKAVAMQWRDFAVWADDVLPLPPERYSNPQLGEFFHGFHSCTHLSPFGPRPSLCHNYEEVAWSSTEDALKRISPALYDAIAESVLGEAYLAAEDIHARCDAAFKNMDKLDLVLREVINALLQRSEPEGLVPELAQQIKGLYSCPSLTRRLQWARWALRRPEEHARSFWAQVRDGTVPYLEGWEEIDARIGRSVPLEEEQHALLNAYLGYGSLKKVIWLHPPALAIEVELILEADWERFACDIIEDRVVALFVPIAYQLAVSLEESQDWPRHIIKCHAPSCGKSFYSPRADWKVCRSSKECRREWMAFQADLKKQHKSPETDWDDEDLKVDFIEKYRPQGRRGRQPRMY